MNKFKWGKAFGFGALIWSIMFVVAAILVGLSVALSVWAMFALAVIAGALSYSFAISANPQTAGEALGYGALWAVIGIVLDLSISRQFSASAGIFGIWTYWLGYVLMLFAPSLRTPSEAATGAQHHPI